MKSKRCFVADTQFPITVSILGQPFQVRILTRDESLFRGADAEAVGCNDLNLQIISVRGPEDLSIAQAVETLLHEVIHGIISVFGLRGHFEDGDEAFTNAFAPALLHTLRDNPDLLKTLLSDFSPAVAGSLEHSHDHGD